MAKHNQLEQEELMRTEILEPEELFLLQYLKGSNRKSSMQLKEVYEWDFEDQD